ncbi:unnamed protein product [Cuscuta epithymum]|uniref:UTP23 sensor motif region domain-containing protein n=1 Tax=Cuscuta epithymum TaxID=186058 RepID=A0AAV0F3N5_9ASTE|nr:unnamed protein product [Cuscuta epithymum]
MKVKKQKRHRRAVRFYAACFGFREPYKILCDGTFVHHLISNRITPADTSLANTLGATVKLFTTRCVVEELKRLGTSYSESLNAARSLLTARCDHESRRSAVACITEIIGEDNPEHFFVATQDADLRKNLMQIPGVPLIYALRNALFLERPSTFQQKFAKMAEEGRSHMTEKEYKALNIKKKRKFSDHNAIDASNGSGEETGHDLEVKSVKMDGERKRSNIKDDKVQFKRKKAKNPNPLSVKKKKPKHVNAVAASEKNPDPLSVKKKKHKHVNSVAA